MVFSYCPKCAGHLRTESIGWKCMKCQGFIDMQGNFHERIEKPFLPPMTNAYRIRAMSDEELVKFIEDTQIAGCPDPARSCRASCKDCIMDWLKQPVEVE